MRDLGRLQDYLPLPLSRPRASPRPDQPSPDASPAAPSPSRFAGLHNNVRSMINGSSVYSDSPAPSNNNTPKIPFLGFLHRPRSPPAPIVVPDHEAPRDSSDSRSPLRPQHTAGSYMRTIAPLDANLRQPEPVLDRHPADVPLDYHGSVDPETGRLQNEVHGRRRRKHKRKRRHHQPTHWIRRKPDQRVCMPFIKSQAARGKVFACIISGLFLMTTLTIYLTLALTRKDLGQEIHVLFIMVILGTTIFFCHSLIRLCMLALHPPAEGPNIPAMTGPEGFHPVRPIRVHLQRDEEDVELGEAADAVPDDLEKPDKIALPPPAYGLWRSSVRVDPNLLHWQRVEGEHGRERNGSVASATGPGGQVIGEASERHVGPRPPSYASDDGVEYVVEAAPRSVAPGSSGVSDIHPAWRPGFAVAEIHRGDGEWGGPTRL